MTFGKTSATNVFCAKAKQQQQMFSVRKRSDSNKASIGTEINYTFCDGPSFCMYFIYLL